MSPFCETSHATRVVPPTTGTDPKFIVIAQSPGRNENYGRKSKTQELLGDLLTHAGLTWDDIYLTYVTKCWPPTVERKDGWGGIKEEQKRPTKKQITTCTDLYLYREIESLPGVPIITLGDVALKTLLPDAKLSETHGQVLKWNDRQVISQYHPTLAWQSPKMDAVVKLDWETLEEKLEQTRNPWKWKAIHDWTAIESELRGASLVAFDYETTDLRPRFADVVGTGICVDGVTGYYYTGDDPLGFFDLIPPQASLTAHNLVYEYGITAATCEREGRPNSLEERANLQDTMIMARLLCKEFIGLKPLALSELGMKMQEFKQVVAGDIRDADPNELARYGAMDVISGYRLYNLFSTQLDEKEKAVYDLEIGLIPLVASIVSEGFKVDGPALERLAVDNERKLSELLTEIRDSAMERMQMVEVPAPSARYPDRVRPQWFMEGRLVGPPGSASHPAALKWEFNPSAPLAVQAFFGINSADEDHLLELSDPLAGKIAEYKHAIKFVGSYLDPIRRSGDRLYGSFNSVGTDTGRFSASGYKLLGGTTVGINLQTAPAAIKPLLLPDNDELVIVDADYSQIELRVLAHMADEEAMKAAYIEGRDLHNEMMERAGISDRRVAKVMNFSLGYNPDDRSAAYVLIRAGRKNPGDPIEISEYEAKNYVALYREAWPQLHPFYVKISHDIERDHYVETLLGRKWYGEFIDNRRKIAQKENWATLRKAINHPIQGTAADIIKSAMLRLWRTRPHWVKFKNTVHDSLVFQVPRGKVDALQEWAVPIMCGTIQLSVPIVVDFEVKS